MAASHTVPVDASVLSRLDQRLFVLEELFVLISGVAIFLLMVLAVVSVGGRNFFNQPLPGYVDWIELAMPLIAFMGVSYVQRLGGHIRMDLFVGMLRGRALWAVELTTTIAILGLVLVLIYGSYSHFLRSFDMAAPLWSRDSSMDIGLPLWPAKLLAPVAFTVLAARLMLHCAGYWRALVTGAQQPIAVPLLEDIQTQAAREAEHVSGMEEPTDQPSVRSD